MSVTTTMQLVERRRLRTRLHSADQESGLVRRGAAAPWTGRLNVAGAVDSGCRPDDVGESVSSAVLSAPQARSAEDQARGRHAGTGGDEYVLDAVHLVDRRAPKLAYAFGDSVHSVDVRLTQLTAMRVDRQ